MSQYAVSVIIILLFFIFLSNVFQSTGADAKVIAEYLRDIRNLLVIIEKRGRKP